MTQYGIETTIDPKNSGLKLSQFFDFALGSSELSEEQAGKMSVLADALAEVFLCYGNNADQLVMQSCQKTDRPVVLNSVYLKVFSRGGNVGTERFNYNWKLATARSLRVLQALVTARPDLLKYKNVEGNSLFQIKAELPKTGNRRSRRMELQFVISK
ncbi:MAG: hypothetical protein HQL69_07100 [Magnetococcales bacterium]|nr:hypothetical protein [Magnetococcales bacterium]